MGLLNALNIYRWGWGVKMSGVLERPFYDNSAGIIFAERFMSPDRDSTSPQKGFGYWINFGLDFYPALF